jgi:hypothetical protein
MVDHLVWAQGYRGRAARCVVAAQNSSSSEYSACYRQLAEYYGELARLEEDFQARAIARVCEETMPAVAY